MIEADSTNETLLSVRNLVKKFQVGKSVVQAVSDVSFDVRRGRTTGIVGESGSGKTTIGRCIMRLVEPTEGEAIFEGEDLFKASGKRLRALRKRLQFIFQDPYSSLNPKMKVADIIGEAIDTHRIAKGAARRQMIGDLLERVGLDRDHDRRFPHEFSGGQRQRIGIARALAVQPDLIVADEPISALDVSVQAQILNLLQSLQNELGLTTVFISHDLTVVEYLCDDVVVLYLGRVMESGRAEDIYGNPRHPYTRALLSSSPLPDPERRRERIVLKGDIPSPISPPSGCVFRTRCPDAIEACAAVVPPIEEVGSNHVVACIRHRELPAWSPARNLMKETP
ncbi:ATP-binding cassette domain-containing protein [Aurantimonas aggregata]|uniref:ATP-binding cassette domain-containing protein n=1 Tax=Aurantimonas aggregata TaxID=2047720 RepID=A0A6L9MMX8_9HYPH|nr:oligopeptide/dipeptide ABC transporter ATP-binding protein [Aurantimonas aggregata]NDV89207.1 ATP-binding cassette domain-containing protein [Aurantimonas aggregata]